MHIVEQFAGQSSPEVSIRSLQTSDMDEPLLLALLKRWRIRYSGKSVKWKDRALFRSLNMANQASQTPGGTDTTYYDVGRSIALWISAFEILAHPPNANANLRVVCELLEKVKWDNAALTTKRYKTYEGRNKSSRRILACSIYGELYKVRNDFLHGNRVRPSRLRLRRTENPLGHYAACLYRMALTTALPQGAKRKNKSSNYLEYFVTRRRTLGHQILVEDAILTATSK
jgi:hypothetical protein